MFKIKQKLDNIYDLLIDFNNNERRRTRATENLMRSYEKEIIGLKRDLATQKAIIEEKDHIIAVLKAENDSLLNIIAEDKKFKEDIKEYLKTVAEILQNNQKEIIKKKPTKADLMTEKMYKVPDEVKAKLK